ncbi:MAG: Npun_F0296 family exosortase-dependent surface protein [Janthinobacterium lividum]
MLKLSLAVAAALTIAGSADALTLVASTNGPDQGPVAGQHMIQNFNTGAGLSGGSLVSGNQPNQYAAPLGDTTQYLAVLGGQTATLDLKAPAKSLSFYWGSIDNYNTVSFYAGTKMIGSYTGAAVPQAPADGNQTSPGNNRRVDFNFGTDRVTSVKFASSQNSFELDSVAAAVPEPATWAMLITGMGLVGVSLRRRRGSTVVAA